MTRRDLLSEPPAVAVRDLHKSYGGADAVVTDVDSASAALPFAGRPARLHLRIFVAVDQLPGWLQDISRFLFPVYHLADGLQTALGIAGDRALGAGNGRALPVDARRDRSGRPQVPLGAAGGRRMKQAASSVR